MLFKENYTYMRKPIKSKLYSSRNNRTDFLIVLVSQLYSFTSKYIFIEGWYSFQILSCQVCKYSAEVFHGSFTSILDFSYNNFLLILPQKFWRYVRRILLYWNLFTFQKLKLLSFSNLENNDHYIIIFQNFALKKIVNH